MFDLKILVTGFAGQLGYDVVKRAKLMNIEAVGIDIETLNLTDVQAVEQYFTKQNDFDAIIHCAAYTNVDKAEEDIDAAKKVNVEATKYLINAAKKMQAKFMYISTDYVYDGDGDLPFTETSPTNPQTVYGLTKFGGEQVTYDYDKTFIVRISWVFGINGHNFIKTMLKLAQTRDEINVVGDQIGSPTYTFDLAILLLEMIKTEKYGLYLAANENYCSWYEFAVAIFEQAGISMKVNKLASAEYPVATKRPLNSRMDKSKLVENGFSSLPTWQDALKRYLIELTTEEK